MTSAKPQARASGLQAGAVPGVPEPTSSIDPVSTAVSPVGHCSWPPSQGRSRLRLTSLSRLRANSANGDRVGALLRALRQSGGRARAVAIWERPDEPFSYFAYWSKGCCEYGRLPLGASAI